MKIRSTYDVFGIVQGVGFRPAVYRMAVEEGIGGSVRNCSGKVELVLEGSAEAHERLLRRLQRELPSQARIEQIIKRGSSMLDDGEGGGCFRIIESASDDQMRGAFPADLAVCPDCLADIADPCNRRFGYPFTTCTNCGPRYTVINALPYDRQRTTLAAFALCAACRAEYHDPGSRRFHAESIACPACGPRLELHASSGEKLTGDPLRQARRLLADGAIVALRGVGGFLLAVNAHDRMALASLRRRKARPAKPFAVMAADISAASRFCAIEKAEHEMLTSVRAPIVILDLLPGAENDLPLDLLAPDTCTLGLMLPTSPLHWLLFNPLPDDAVPAFDLLVMTSGNRRGEPICIANEEAFERLAGVADYILCHDREINLRADDSICARHGGQQQVWRRARGYAPEAVRLKSPLKRCVLAMGAEQKNALALGSDDRLLLSAHIGDLETPEALDSLEAVSRSFPRFFDRRPQAIAVDLHPDMHATRLGVRLARELDLPLIRVQHHHAHAAAVLAEHGLDRCLALVWDGTGLGSDGSIWGAELLHLEGHEFTRLATFAPAPLPGGDAAVRRPVRGLVGRLAAAGLPCTADMLAPYEVCPEELAIWLQQITQGVNAPLSHAAGRLFDAVSAALGIAPDTASYDGQAAVRLEAAAKCSTSAMAVPEVLFSTRKENAMLIVDWSSAFQQLLEMKHRFAAPAWALAFHLACVRAAGEMLEHGVQLYPGLPVVLTGGVFMNRILTAELSRRCAQLGYQVLLAQTVPPNDGGIAGGQAFIAGAM